MSTPGVHHNCNTNSLNPSKTSSEATIIPNGSSSTPARGAISSNPASRSSRTKNTPLRRLTPRDFGQNHGKPSSSIIKKGGTAKGKAASLLEHREKVKRKRHPMAIPDHITVISGEERGDSTLTMYQCDVCINTFKTKAHIKYHEFCQGGEKPFKCKECGQGFIAKSHYQYHLRTHTGEKPYICPQCGKGFRQSGKVTRHMRCHTGEKPFICIDCGRGFAQSEILQAHRRSHTGKRPFECKLCNKSFAEMTHLNRHKITHTREKKFACPRPQCGKRFGLKWNLDLHLRTHSSERPYPCDQCSRAFSNSKDLKRHCVIHSGVRAFKCGICDSAFSRKDNRDRHAKTTHRTTKELTKPMANNETAAHYLAASPDNSESSCYNVMETEQLNVEPEPESESKILIQIEISESRNEAKESETSNSIAVNGENPQSSQICISLSTSSTQILPYYRYLQSLQGAIELVVKDTFEWNIHNL